MDVCRKHLKENDKHFTKKIAFMIETSSSPPLSYLNIAISCNGVLVSLIWSKENRNNYKSVKCDRPFTVKTYFFSHVVLADDSARPERNDIVTASN